MELTLADELKAIRRGVSPAEAMQERKLSYQETIHEQWRTMGLYEHANRTPTVRESLTEQPLDSDTIRAELKQSKRTIQLAFNDVAAGFALGVGVVDSDGTFSPLPEEVVAGLQDAIAFGGYRPYGT